MDGISTIDSDTLFQPIIAPSFVRQRLGHADCSIASLATALDWTYESAAHALGYPCDEHGSPRGIPEAGLSISEIGHRLLPHGIASTLIVSRVAPQHTAVIGMPTVDKIKLAELLAGRLAIVAMIDPADPDQRGHAVAWRRDRLIDCRFGFEMPLTYVTIAMTVVLSPIEQTELGEGPDAALRAAPFN